ncbi:hypothetical protein [Streptomyces sp. NPDC002386]
MSDTTAPPAPAPAAPAPPDPAAAAPQPTPPPAPAPVVDQDATEPRQRSPRRRGVPIEPLVIGAGNGTAIAATAAYQVGGPVGLAAAAGTAVALAAGGLVQRRRTVRTRTTTGAGRTRAGAGAAARGRGRGGASGSLSGRGASGRGGAARRGAALGAGTAGRGGAGRTRRGALGSLGVGAGRGKAPRLNSPRLPSPSGGGAGKHRRPGGRGGSTPSTGSTQKRTPRRRSRLGMVRPAASAARRGMAGVGRIARGTGRGVGAAARGVGAAARSTGRGIRAAARGVGRTAQRTARPARTLWNRTARARRAAARRAGRVAGALWDGALAGIVGVATGLWQRSWRRGLWGVGAMWRRRRMNRAARRAAAGPAMTGPAIANTPPPVATYVRRPATAGGSPSAFGGSTMPGGHHFLAPAMEMERIAATYTPDGMMQVGADFAALPDALEHVANAMRISTARADQEQPLDPRIVELMKEIYALQMKAVDLARELPVAFRRLHDVDIARIENPRTGEPMWDYSRNAGATL